MSSEQTQMKWAVLVDEIVANRMAFDHKSIAAHDFSSTYNRLMHELDAEIQASNFRAVDFAFGELRGTPKDSWYGTMQDILKRLDYQLPGEEL